MGTSRQEILRVSTSDNIGIGYELAGLGSRFIAQLVDGAIVGSVMLVLAMVMTGLIHPTDDRSSVLAALAVGGVSLMVYVGYFTVCELATGGRTPGKTAGHLMVLSLDGSAPTAGQLLVRNVARVVDVIGGIGVVVMFINRRSQRVGDLLAGTVVVHVRAAASLAAVVAPPPVMLRTPDAGPAMDGLEQLGERELSAVRAFLTRPGLEPPLRARLAADMTERLVDRMQLGPAAPERQWPAELFLERLYLQLQTRVRG